MIASFGGAVVLEMSVLDASGRPVMTGKFPFALPTTAAWPSVIRRTGCRRLARGSPIAYSGGYNNGAALHCNIRQAFLP